MLSLVIFIMVVASFGVLAAFRWGRVFEETLPISAMGIVLSLFLAGMVNGLLVGAILVSIVAVAFYIYTIYWLIKNKNKEAFINGVKNLFTPGFFVFAIMCGILAHANKDRLAMHTDEFSHWLDTVVIMTGIDKFGTAPNSTAVFPSYPPAMSLFQYLLEKINMLFTGDFSEWKVYFAYQLFAVIIMLPFTRTQGLSIPKKIVAIVSWPICLVLPLYFFPDVYSSLYIDPFLGVLGGCGFAAVSITKNKDWVYNTYLTMLCAVLVLSKDVGIYLAIFISIYYVVDYLSRLGISKKSILLSITPLAAMIVAKMLWKLELAITDTAQKFSQPFDLKGTIATYKGQGSEFATTVYDNFKGAMTYRYIYYERLGFNYSTILFLFVVAYICLHTSLFRRNQLKKSAAIVGAVIPSVAIIFYILSMFPLYISRFAEVEALNLASFDRYCGIMFLTGLLLMVWLGRDMLIDADGKVIPVIIAVVCLWSVFHSQHDAIDYYTSRRSVQDSLSFRANVDALAAKINENCEENAHILVIGQDGDEIYTAVLSTLCKPRVFMENSVYFPNSPAEDGSLDMTVEEFEKLVSNEFDYVAVYRNNASISGCLFEAFEDAESISDGAIYIFSNGKLQLM